MSSATERCTLPNNTDDAAAVSPHGVLLAAGVLGSVAQCAYLREALTIFSGNELVIGLVLAVWLGSVGMGSLAGGAMRRLNVASVVFGAAVSATGGIIAMRAVRLLFDPGIAISPAVIPVVAACQTPAAFFCGMVFGYLTHRPHLSIDRVYAADSAGNAGGLIMAWLSTIVGVPNALTLGLATTVCAGAARGIRGGPAGVIVAAAALLFLDGTTIRWKYGAAVSTVKPGREGEIAYVIRQSDTTLMLNGTMLRSTIGSGMLEQSVHVPMALHPSPSRVLLIHDRGQRSELKRYEGLTVDVLESDPALADVGSIIGAAENFRPALHYDVVFIGVDIPGNAAEGRMLTAGFFLRMKRLMNPSGLLTFTLSLSSNYLSEAERKLLEVERATLSRVFRYVRVFPGEGYTFLASDRDIGGEIIPRVNTYFLSSQILPAVDSTRIARANDPLETSAINTAARPLALLLGLERWMQLMGTGWWLLAVVLAALLVAGLAFVPRRATITSTLSIATSGCAAGVYSVALMLMYQSTYGVLYSRVALLLVTFTIGCVVGSRIRYFPLSDAAIGIYAWGSLLMTTVLPAPPATLFFICHGVMGLLIAAQFVTVVKNDADALYAADLMGGVLGMALCSTVLVPLAGVPVTAAGIGAVKVVVAAFVIFRRPHFSGSILPLFLPHKKAKGGVQGFPGESGRFFSTRSSF